MKKNQAEYIEFGTQDGQNVTRTGHIDRDAIAGLAVTGQAPLMYARQPGQVGWPETTKAAVLASAFHDIEPGRSRDGVGAVMDNISDDT